MRLIAAARAALDSWTARVDLLTAELRHGVSYVETVSRNEFETELRALTSSVTQRDEIREAAIEIGRSGLSADEVRTALNDFLRDAPPRWWKIRPETILGDDTDPATANDIAHVISDTFVGGYVPFSVRYGLAHELIRAGYSKGNDHG
jgi:hypothetical protein